MHEAIIRVRVRTRQPTRRSVTPPRSQTDLILKCFGNIRSRILHQTLIYLKLTQCGNLKTCLVYVGKIVVYTQKIRTRQSIFPRNYFNTLVKRLSFQPAAISQRVFICMAEQK